MIETHMREPKNREAMALNMWICSPRGEARFKFNVGIFSWIPDWGPKTAVILPSEISRLIAYVSSYSTIYRCPHMKILGRGGPFLSSSFVITHITSGDKELGGLRFTMISQTRKYVTSTSHPHNDMTSCWRTDCRKLRNPMNSYGFQALSSKIISKPMVFEHDPWKSYEFIEFINLR